MPFAPTDLSNLYPWFKADAITGLVNDDPVATWPDSSGLGKDLTQGTAGNRPLYKTGVLNGLPGVLFDGTSDGMATAAFAVAMSQPTTIFAVAKAAANDATQRHLTDGIGSGGRNVILDGGTSSTNWRAYAGSFITASGRDTNVNIFTALFNNTSSVLRKNGTQIASGTAGTNTLTGLAVGTSNLGAGGAGNFWTGHVFELILYNADHTAAFKDVEQYLAGRWGVVLPGARPRPRRRLDPGLIYR